MYTRSLLHSRTFSSLPSSVPFITRPCPRSCAIAIATYRSYHQTTILSYIHNNINDNEHNYTITEADAEGIMNTDDVIPPMTNTNKKDAATVAEEIESGYDFDHELNQQYEWNEREPAADASNSGGTLNEMKQFAGNVLGRTREALKGESRTSSHGTNPSESTQPPRRFVASSTKIKDQATQAASDTKEAIKKAATAAGAEMAKNKNQAEANASAASSKANAQNVVENAKEAVSDAYNTAKQAVSKGTQEVKKKANEYANTASEKASEVADNIKKSTENMKETFTGTSTEPRTDNPIKQPPIQPRTDRPGPTVPKTGKPF